ncbi:hypothetical protein [Alkalinema sp. FACHB-956]|uniref:hypothetical protein n=1 Tax=Alkalinema sp. FACHB-956 TaxID=2692768 RepID=UPI0016839F02|nr:hypothetical protein [Alkalinema sp. FACHB-956]MBD2325450.1 hypothetical protein [Alkalinema sp. FACHB-956]
MYSQKPSKIELTEEYPCPCRRRAKLVPITLTEAFGCEHCQNIFVVAPEGDQIEQLSGLYTARRSWRWTGEQWALIYPGRDSYLITVASLLGVLLLAWILVIRYLPASIVTLFCIVSAFLLMVVLPAVRSWFSNRR